MRAFRGAWAGNSFAWLAAALILLPPLPSGRCVCLPAVPDSVADDTACGGHGCCRSKLAAAAKPHDCCKSIAKRPRDAVIAIHSGCDHHEQSICTCYQRHAPLPAAPATTGGSTFDQLLATQLLAAPPLAAALINAHAGGQCYGEAASPSTSLERCILLSRFVI